MRLKKQTRGFTPDDAGVWVWVKTFWATKDWRVILSTPSKNACGSKWTKLGPPNIVIVRIWCLMFTDTMWCHMENPWKALVSLIDQSLMFHKYLCSSKWRVNCVSTIIHIWIFQHPPRFLCSARGSQPKLSARNGFPAGAFVAMDTEYINYHIYIYIL